MKINTREMYFNTSFKVRSEEEDKYIEGYFIRFNEETELWPGGAFEEVHPDCIDESLKKTMILEPYLTTIQALFWVGQAMALLNSRKTLQAYLAR